MALVFCNLPQDGRSGQVVVGLSSKGINKSIMFTPIRRSGVATGEQAQREPGSGEQPFPPHRSRFSWGFKMSSELSTPPGHRRRGVSSLILTAAH